MNIFEEFLKPGGRRSLLYYFQIGFSPTVEGSVYYSNSNI